MQKYAERLYKSKTWQKTREAYAKSAGGLCEVCLKKGLYNPGVIVHHIVPITPDNIECPEVTLAFSNLQLVCRDCHAQFHDFDRRKRRYKLDELGRVTAIE